MSEKEKGDNEIKEEKEGIEAPKEAPAPPDEEEEAEGKEEGGAEENEGEEEEGEEGTEAEEEDEEEEDEDEEDEKEDKEVKKMKKDEDGDKFAKFAAIAGGVGIAVFLLGAGLDILAWVLPVGGFIIGCFTCMIWPVFLLGFIGAVLGIVLGIVALVKGTEEKKMMAFLGIGLGAGYFFLQVVWVIVSIFAPW